MTFIYLVDVYTFTGRILTNEYGSHPQVDFRSPVEQWLFHSAGDAYFFARSINEYGEQWAMVSSQIERT